MDFQIVIKEIQVEPYLFLGKTGFLKKKKISEMLQGHSKILGYMKRNNEACKFLRVI